MEQHGLQSFGGSQVTPADELGIVPQDCSPLKKTRSSAVAAVSTSPIAKAGTRYGIKTGDNRIFSKDKRWTSGDDEVGPPQYLLKPMRSEREPKFGTSTRTDWGKIMGLIPKINPNAGPGAYRITETMILSSEMPRQPTIRFGSALRPSMDMKTLGPGPAYDLEGKFKSGKDFPHKLKPGFNLDRRKPLVNMATDAMYHPPLRNGVSCTIKKRHEPSEMKLNQMRSGPAPHDYEHMASDAKLRKAPAFTFHRAAPRFKGVDKVAEMMKMLDEADAQGADKDAELSKKIQTRAP